MNNKIFGINDISRKAETTLKNKKANRTGSDLFSKLLDKAVSCNASKETAAQNEVSQLDNAQYINPLGNVNLNKAASEYVSKNIDEILSGLETFSQLLANKKVAAEDIKPLIGKIKNDTDDILRYSEKNNISNDLKSIVKESSALAYAAAEKLNKYV